MVTFVPEMRLFDNDGKRLYLTADERKNFLHAAEYEPREKRMFCNVLHYTGCRPSEALELSPSKINISEKSIIFRTLKKRKLDNQGRQNKPQYRHVPVPSTLIKDLSLVFDLRRKGVNQKQDDFPFWAMSRATAWRTIKKVMAAAGIDGPQATGKGLRHSFGVSMISGGAPVTLVRDLLGHTDVKTTEIYLQVIGTEKRNLVMAAWDKTD